MGNEVEFIELEEELLPALAVGVRRLSDGVHALKLTLETLSEQVKVLREESVKLAHLLEANKELLDEERKKLAKHVEDLNEMFEDFMSRLDKSVKAALDLGLEGVDRKLRELNDRVAEASQEVQASRLESRERTAIVMGEISDLRGEVYELKSRISDLSKLVYELDMRIRRLEENLTAGIKEVKLLIGELSLNMRKA
ncbi:MAG: hypothetical protein DRJ57_02300 [Thermoprotei archaeon]|nr:MAG: hypothetical protein DRJ57_02300 [Thermoprotei archaeon]